MVKKKTIEKFIEEAENKHINVDGTPKYDYSNVKYDGNDKKVSIICRKQGHGSFEQQAGSHLKGHGCPKCGQEEGSTKNRKTIEQFKIEAENKHRNVDGTPKYDYKLVNYINDGTEVLIICPKQGHGIFKQQAGSHTSGHGCIKCGFESSSNKQKKQHTENIDKTNNKIISKLGNIVSNKMKTNKQFITECINKHKNIDGTPKYDYSCVLYKGKEENVDIICKIVGHGIFSQQANSHVRGAGCPKCGLIRSSTKNRKLTEQFKTEAENKHRNVDGTPKYDYSCVLYKGKEENIDIICKVEGHGMFTQKANNHVRGAGCPICARDITSKKLLKTTSQFIEEAKNKHTNNDGTPKYDYSRVNYVGDNEKITIICREQEHGEFEQTAGSHIQGHGCPSCINKTEGILKKFLDSKYANLTCQFKFRNYIYPFDFCIEESKLIIELDGAQHFIQVSNWTCPELTQERDIEKMKYALNNGYSIIRLLQEDVWCNLIEWEKFLLNAIDICTQSSSSTIIYICDKNEYAPYYDKIINYSHTLIQNNGPSITFEV